MTTQVADMEVLKEIPGYKAIMKAVLKTQIQLLVEQLCDHTGEESIILTASVNDGSLSHLGSITGKGFLEGREEIKSQFLGYCLKSHHRKKTQEVEQPYQRSNISHPSPRTSVQQAQKRQRLHPVPSSKSPQPSVYPPADDNFAPPPKRPFQERSRPQEQVRESFSDRQGGQEEISNVKVEHEGDIQNDDDSEQTDQDKTSSFTSQSLPPSLQLSHTQTSDNAEYGDTSQSEDNNTNIASEPGLDSTNIKIEPDTDLEITGVEMSEGGTENWGEDMSGAMGYGSSDAGDGSFDQSANQSGYGSDWSQSVVLSHSYDTQQKLTIQHSMVNSTVCQIRGKDLIYRSYLEPHLMSHTKNKMNNNQQKLRRQKRAYNRRVVNETVCHICGKDLVYRSYLERHLRSHTKSQPYQCNTCGTRFTQQSSLNVHYKRRGHC